MEMKRITEHPIFEDDADLQPHSEVQEEGKSRGYIHVRMVAEG